MERSLKRNNNTGSHCERNGSNFLFSKDQLILLSTEKYSDYGYAGPFVCNADFDLSVIADEVQNSNDGKSGPNSVTLHLLEKGLISKVGCREVHLGSYGNIELSDWEVSKSNLDFMLEHEHITEPDYKVTIMQYDL